MKKILFIPILNIILFLVWSGAVFAQEPGQEPSLCIYYNGVYTSSIEFRFDGPSLPDGWRVGTTKEYKDFKINTAGSLDGDYSDCGPVRGRHTPNVGYELTTRCGPGPGRDGGWHGLLINDDLVIRSPITGTRTSWITEQSATAHGPKFGGYDSGTRNEWFRSGLVLGSGQIAKGRAVSPVYLQRRAGGDIQWRSLTITCGVGTLPDPDGEQICPLVTNANFSDPSGWLLSGTASITNGVLSLAPGAQAAQNLSTLNSNTDYTATISVTQAASTTLDVELGGDQRSLSISGPGVYTASFTTPSLSGPTHTMLRNAGAGDLEITYYCLSPADGDQCPLVPNANFSRPDDWQLTGLAIITQGLLSLEQGETASQNISGLSPNVDYTAVISTWFATGSDVQLSVSLGDQTKTIDIPPGPPVTMNTQYKVDFTTSAGLSGPLEYKIEFSGSDGITNIDSACLTLKDDQCPLVPNANFSRPDDWQLTGLAIITQGLLSLEQGETASQNISGLSPNVDYTAVISTWFATGSDVQLSVSLGDQTKTIDIPPGPPVTMNTQYKVDFTTPAGLSGPLEYKIEFSGSEGITNIDSACLTLKDDPSKECIGPTNTDFSTADDWEYHRGAQWSQAKFARLPYSADNYGGLIQTTNTYPLPALNTGEYLLLSFDAQNEGIVGAGVLGSTWAEGYFQTYEDYYTYEMDVSTLAGDTASISVSNTGHDPVTETDIGDGPIEVDNVCLFVSNRPPQLPHPIDPNSPPDIDLDMGIYSCDDVDGIWAWFGVNMAQHRAVFAAGGNLLPWLVSAVFVLLADWSCLFMAAFVSLTNLFQFILNNLLNYLYWFYQTSGGALAWSGGWLLWLYQSTGNILAAYFSYVGSIILWVWESAGNIISALLLQIVHFALWFYNSGLNIIGPYFEFLSNWAVWLALSGGNIFGWWVVVIATVAAWLLDVLMSGGGVRTIINWLIAGWNGFMTATGEVVSSLIDLAISWVWNDSILPLFQAMWDFLATYYFAAKEILALLIDFSLTILNLLTFFLLWLWTNIITTVSAPLDFYKAFNEGLNSDAYAPLVTCTGVDFWCTFLAGVQLINQLFAHSIFYPITIVGIILSTIYIVWWNLSELFSINIDFSSFR